MDNKDHQQLKFNEDDFEKIVLGESMMTEHGKDQTDSSFTKNSEENKTVDDGIATPIVKAENTSKEPVTDTAESAPPQDNKSAGTTGQTSQKNNPLDTDNIGENTFPSYVTKKTRVTSRTMVIRKRLSSDELSLNTAKDFMSETIYVPLFDEYTLNNLSIILNPMEMNNRTNQRRRRSDYPRHKKTKKLQSHDTNHW
ncbi:hypothetical protein BDB01DRAFT_851247 [Pilobolus umbonatus]|nr:hypothetical protein BDB01DRAFT_851247 [Pilobolus umbonatus]